MLGRYWRRGPQRTLYLPAPATRAGRNELVVLELEVMADPTARFVAQLDLGYDEE
jgi:beta-galactosidase